jgi:hypothetical protein
VSPVPSLLESVGGILERTYRIESGLDEIGPFVIGDAGYRELYARRIQHRSVGQAAGGARTLVRETGETVHARIYFPDSLIRTLEAYPPQIGIGEPNVDAFSTFVEEIDHLLLIAERALEGRPVSLFELELHANVSKHLVLARYVARDSGALSPEDRRWLRARLFDGELGSDQEPQIQERYRDATRYAIQLLDALSSLAPRRRVATLRRFHTMDCGRKLELIDRI